MSASNFSLSFLVHFLFFTLVSFFSFVTPEVAPVINRNINLNYLGSINTVIREDVAKNDHIPPKEIQEETKVPELEKPKKSLEKTKKVDAKRVIISKVVSEEKLLEPESSKLEILAREQTEGAIKISTASYREVFIAKIMSEKRYPEKARKRGVEGQGLLDIKVGKEGNILSLSLIESSGSEILDEEILSLVYRCAPFPKLPSELSHFSARLPIQFKINP